MGVKLDLMRWRKNTDGQRLWKKDTELRRGNVRGLGSTACYKIERDVVDSETERRYVIPRWHISQCHSYVKVSQSQSVRFRKERFYSGGPCEYGKVHSGAIKYGQFFDW